MSSRRARSRRSSSSTSNEAQALWQTGAMIAGSIVLAILFLVFLMPRIVDVAFDYITEDVSETQQQDTIPPQAPVLSAPPTATSSATVSLQGFTEAQSSVRLLVNGERAAAADAGEDGAFSIEIELPSGENEITAVAIDAAGNESRQSRSYLITIDSEAPEIQLEQPADGETFYGLRNQTITIRGTTEPGASVYINGSLTYADREEGVFETSLRLEEGDNELTIRAVDAADNETELTRVVRFEQ